MFLTKRQRQIYDYIKDFIEEQGYAPSIVEIGENFNLTSPATVHKHLQNLSQKGMIKRSWNKSRAIELMPETISIGNRSVKLLIVLSLTINPVLISTCGLLNKDK